MLQIPLGDPRTIAETGIEPLVDPRERYRIT
jgi:hypothetical protein